MAPRLHGIPRIGRFSIVGGLNTLVDLAVFLLLVKLFSVPLVPANLLAFAVALANSYLLNRLWTFHDSATATSLGTISRFVLFNICGALLATAALALLAALGLPVLAAKLLAIAVSMAWNYLTMRHFVFRPGR
jgi:putative flippase GtrA